jgi:hypothetical protein
MEGRPAGLGGDVQVRRLEMADEARALSAKLAEALARDDASIDTGAADALLGKMHARIAEIEPVVAHYEALHVQDPAGGIYLDMAGEAAAGADTLFAAADELHEYVAEARR